MARGRIDLSLPQLSGLIGFEDVILYLDDKCFRLTERNRSFNYLEAGVDFDFTENIGLTLACTNGYDSPKFIEEEVLKGGFTIKF